MKTDKTEEKNTKKKVAKKKTAKKTAKIETVVIDIGQSRFKVEWSGGKFIVPFYVAAATKDRVHVDGMAEEATSIKWIDSNDIAFDYWVGWDSETLGMPVTNIDPSRLFQTPEFTAAYYATLSHFHGKKITIKFSVPNSLISDKLVDDTDETVAEVTKKLVESQAGVHEFIRDGKRMKVDVTHTSHMSQAHAALFGLMIGDDLKTTAVADRITAGNVVLVVSGGSHSVEWIGTNKFGKIDAGLCGSTPKGITSMILSSQVLSGYEDGERDQLYAMGKLKVEDNVRQAYVASVGSSISRQTGRRKDEVDQVFALGGGANTILPALNNLFGSLKVDILEDPVFHIATSLYKKAQIEALS